MTFPTTVAVADTAVQSSGEKLITGKPVSGQCSGAVVCGGFSVCACVCTRICVCIPQYNLMYEMTAALPLVLK